MATAYIDKPFKSFEEMIEWCVNERPVFNKNQKFVRDVSDFQISFIRNNWQDHRKAVIVDMENNRVSFNRGQLEALMFNSQKHYNVLDLSYVRLILNKHFGEIK